MSNATTKAERKAYKEMKKAERKARYRARRDFDMKVLGHTPLIVRIKAL